MYSKVSGIYQIESQINPNKVYVGSGWDIRKRWRQHKRDLRKNCHGNPKLQCHYNKYGEEDLIFSILLVCERNELIKNEQTFIDSINPWFNINLIADRPTGIRRDPEVGRKHSLRMSGENNPFWGKHHTDSTIKYLSKIRTGSKRTKESREKQSKTTMGHVGHQHSEESKRKQSIKMMGHVAWNKGLKIPFKSRKSKKKMIGEIITLLLNVA